MQNKFYDNNVIECGIDEAGKGPLLGNVYAAAVILDDNLLIPDNLIIDSKKLSKKKRKEAYEWIIENIKYYGIGYATNEEIDQINILEATKLAMERAINDVLTKLNSDTLEIFYLIDGCGWEKKFNNLHVKSIIKGDSKLYSIAAASILAKENHDMHILELINNNPELKNYDLEKNMGYGTKNHIEAIKKYGYTNYHRKSFNLKK
jgi:ribonuclease HII